VRFNLLCTALTPNFDSQHVEAVLFEGIGGGKVHLQHIDIVYILYYTFSHLTSVRLLTEPDNLSVAVTFSIRQYPKNPSEPPSTPSPKWSRWHCNSRGAGVPSDEIDGTCIQLNFCVNVCNCLLVMFFHCLRKWQLTRRTLPF
jgi:hypothetical protein